MNFESVLRERRSIRQFKQDPVSDELIQSLLEQALASPSSSNTQPYRIAVATGEIRNELKQQLSRKFLNANAINRSAMPLKLIKGVLSNDLPDGDFKPNNQYPKELKKRASECGHGLYSTLGIARQDIRSRDQQMLRNFEFFDAPVAIFLFIQERLGVYSALDGGIFLQSLMLAATNMGLGTCTQGALGLWSSPIKKLFDVPKDYKLICGLSLGYPDPEHAINRFQPHKRSIDELILPLKNRFGQ